MNAKDEWRRIQALIPKRMGEGMCWDAMSDTVLSSHIDKMKNTPQNPIWHGEGDVWTHTRMVVEALLADEEYWTLSRRSQEMVFISALMHDIAKPACTVMQDGVWRSHNHVVVGARIARELLWVELGMCGTQDAIAFRESVCTMIRYHGAPLHLGEKSDPERYLISVAANGELATDFSLKLLCMLVRADVNGRIADDIEDKLQDVEYTHLLAEELGILDKPYAFPSSATGRAYLSGKSVSRDFAIYDSSWTEVLMLSGLPGTGKDYYIFENYSNRPVISLDDIRQELKISPTDKEKQGVVVAEAKERARVLLRSKTPFVWNATNITPKLRASLIDFFERYDAYTHIVYLEAPLETELERNAGRERVVPEAVIYRLLSKMEPPTPTEAHLVEWVSV